MKTFKQHINEKWVMTAKMPLNNFDIFKNPTRKEFLEILTTDVMGEENMCRGLFDNKTGDVYIFAINFLHEIAKRKLGLSTQTVDTQNIQIQKKQKRVFVLRSIQIDRNDLVEMVSNSKNLNRILGTYSVGTYS